MDAKSKSKIIVVGGAGFVGNAIYTKCVKMGEDCVSITRSDIDLLCENSIQKLRGVITSDDRVVLPYQRLRQRHMRSIIVRI